MRIWTAAILILLPACSSAALPTLSDPPAPGDDAGTEAALPAVPPRASPAVPADAGHDAASSDAGQDSPTDAPPPRCTTTLPDYDAAGVPGWNGFNCGPISWPIYEMIYCPHFPQSPPPGCAEAVNYPGGNIYCCGADYDGGGI